jgi:5-methylcytosine-specific restriction enzyme A
MNRAEFSKATKLQRFQHCGGKCEACGVKLTPATGTEYDHHQCAAFNGSADFDNCRCYCRNCHGTKTNEKDKPEIAHANRVRAKHLGIGRRTSRPMPGSRASGLKKKMDGTVVRRLSKQ